jgi:hypothetical protein
MVAIDDHGGAAHGRRTAPRAGRLVSALFGAGLAAYGAANINVLPWSETATAVAAKSWPVAEAHVVSAALDEIAVPTPDGVGIERSLSVAYEFKVDGQAFAGSSASLNDRGSADDRRLLALFRKAEFARITGRTLPVAYDPHRPSRAYLQAAVPWGRLLPGLARGAAAFLMAGWFFARAFARQPEREFHH